MTPYEPSVSELFNRWVASKSMLSISCSHEDFSFIGLAVLHSATEDELEFSQGLALTIELGGAIVKTGKPKEIETRVLSRVIISSSSGLRFTISEIDMTPSNVPVIG